MANARLIARDGVFDQAKERYMVVNQYGQEALDDWTPLFSVAAEAYEKITGEEPDSADCQIISTVDGHEEFSVAAGIAGDEQAGIAVLDNRAYEFCEGVASQCRVGDEWADPTGSYLFRVTRNGDGESWERIADDTDA